MAIAASATVCRGGVIISGCEHKCLTLDDKGVYTTPLRVLIGPPAARRRLLPPKT